MMAETRLFSGAEYSNITITDEARAHLGNSYVSNHIYVTSTLAREVYRACMKSSSSFESLAKDIASFRSLLEMTEDAVGDLGLDTRHAEHVTTVVSACKDCLNEVKLSVAKYNNLPIATQQTWERMQWGAEEISELQIRLGRNIGILGSLNSTLSSSSQRAVIGMLRKFMGEVQSGQREGSLASRHTIDSLTMDEREAWRELRKELEDVGITPTIFALHRELITRTLQDAISNGLLEEATSPLEVIREGQSVSSTFASTEELVPIPVFTGRHMPILQMQIQQKDNHGGEIEEALPELNDIESGRYFSKAMPSEKFNSENQLQQTTEAIPRKPLSNSIDRFNNRLPHPKARRPSRTAKLLNNIFGKNKKFLSAVNADDKNAVRISLEKEADIDTRDEKGMTALMIACEKGFIDMVHLLVQNGANIEARGSSRQTPLTIACYHHQTVIAQFLIQIGADIEAATHWPQEDLGIESTDFGESTYFFLRLSSALIHAVEEGHEEIVQLLCQSGANLESQIGGGTALSIASARGHYHVVQILIDGGAALDSVDKWRKTPLMRASEKGHCDVVQILIDRGAALDSADRGGQTSLIKASLEGRLDVVKLLLDYGADMNRKTINGATALDVAVRLGREHIELLLRDRGARRGLEVLCQ